MLSHSKEIIELEGANETPVISILKEKKRKEKSFFRPASEIPSLTSQTEFHPPLRCSQAQDWDSEEVHPATYLVALTIPLNILSVLLLSCSCPAGSPIRAGTRSALLNVLPLASHIGDAQSMFAERGRESMKHTVNPLRETAAFSIQ